MKKLITILMMAFAVVAISCGGKATAPSNDNDDYLPGFGIPGVDDGINDALERIEYEQLGGVREFTKYYRIFEMKNVFNGVDSKGVISFYLNADKSEAKQSQVQRYEGASGGINYNNEIVLEEATQYDVTELSGIEIVREGGTTVDYKNYKLYKMDIKKNEMKISKPYPGATGEWKTSSALPPEYYLMKDASNGDLYSIGVTFTSSVYSIGADVNLDVPTEDETLIKL